jgi:hypothetical protein
MALIPTSAHSGSLGGGLRLCNLPLTFAAYKMARGQMREGWSD